MISELDPEVVRRLADMYAVYRMFDRDGELLYLGITGHIGRFDEHSVKTWFRAVRNITLEWHETEASARVSEKYAIVNEQPLYNIMGKQQRTSATASRSVPAPKERDVLADLLAVFGEAPGMHWGTLAGRLAKRFPDRWTGATKDVISAQCRALGIRSVDVRADGQVLKGCRRITVEKAAAAQVAR
jgi:hypothetical protein